MSETLAALVARAKEAFDALSPVEQALHLSDQRRSFLRGMGCDDPPRDILADEVRDLAAANAQLERDRDEAIEIRDYWSDFAAKYAKERDAAIRERDEVQMALRERILHWQDATSQRDAANAARKAAEGERDRAREALEPFARVADTEIGGDEDDNDWFTTTALKLKVGHFRNALAALTPAPEAPTDGE